MFDVNWYLLWFFGRSLILAQSAQSYFLIDELNRKS